CGPPRPWTPSDALGGQLPAFVGRGCIGHATRARRQSVGDGQGVRHGATDPRKILRDTRTPRAHAIRVRAGRFLSLRGGSCYFFFLLAVLLLAGSTAIASASVYVMSTTSPTDTRSRLLGFFTLMGLLSPFWLRSVTVPAALSIAAMVARTVTLSVTLPPGFSPGAARV